ncbi:MAG: flagellar basal body-associated FliL family protein [Gammaproteobacteria bacterium]
MYVSLYLLSFYQERIKTEKFGNLIGPEYTRCVNRVVLLALLSLLFLPAFVAAEEDEAGGAKPVIEYLEMVPKFTVNLAGHRKYLMIDVQLMIEGKENLDKVKKHMPALRHELIMLYSGRHTDELATMEQRETLRQETLDTIRKTLDKYENSDGLRDVFFTEFLLN